MRLIYWRATDYRLPTENRSPEATQRSHVVLACLMGSVLHNPVPPGQRFHSFLDIGRNRSIPDHICAIQVPKPIAALESDHCQATISVSIFPESAFARQRPDEIMP